MQFNTKKVGPTPLPQWVNFNTPMHHSCGSKFYTPRPLVELFGTTTGVLVYLVMTHPSIPIIIQYFDMFVRFLFFGQRTGALGDNVFV